MRTITEMTPPLTARSVALSVLLGAGPEGLSVRDILATADVFAIAHPTMRTALSRMVGAGDVVAHDARYVLSPRHRARRDRQAADLDPPRVDAHGRWHLLVVTASGRDAADRVALRSTLRAERWGELREGVWMRPATLPGALDDALRIAPAATEGFDTVPADPVALARRLWDLDTWAGEARGLAVVVDDATRAASERFVAAAAAVRHLRTDPVLPPECTPDAWPAAHLREAYTRYRDAFAAGTLPPSAESA